MFRFLSVYIIKWVNQRNVFDATWFFDHAMAYTLQASVFVTRSEHLGYQKSGVVRGECKRKSLFTKR